MSVRLSLFELSLCAVMMCELSLSLIKSSCSGLNHQPLALSHLSLRVTGFKQSYTAGVPYVFNKHACSVNR